MSSRLMPPNVGSGNWHNLITCAPTIRAQIRVQDGSGERGTPRARPACDGVLRKNVHALLSRIYLPLKTCLVAAERQPYSQLLTVERIRMLLPITKVCRRRRRWAAPQTATEKLCSVVSKPLQMAGLSPASHALHYFLRLVTTSFPNFS